MKMRLKLARCILAAIMLLTGMVLSCGTVAKDPAVVRDNGTENQYTAVFGADVRKEEKTSTTSELYARAAVLMDGSSGRILIGKNEDEALPMASTTKIMTCIMVLEKGNLQDMIPVSSYGASQPKVHMGVKKGEYYKAEDLLYSLMLESHNDTAVILAEYYGSKWNGKSTDCTSHSDEESRKAVTAFALEMNHKAKTIGCSDTFFVTPNGLDGTLYIETNEGKKEIRHHTTAADLALLMKYCVWDSPAREKFLQITQADSYEFSDYRKKEKGARYEPGSKTVSCTNHNAFLHMMDGVLSGKTGYTGKAGYCYVAALEKENRKYTVALLACGWPDNKTWKWKDASLLFEYGLKHYELKDVFRQTEHFRIPVERGQEEYVTAEIQKDSLELLLGKNDRIEVVSRVPEFLLAPISAGEKVGEQNYYVNGTLFATLPVYTVNNVFRINYMFCLKKIISRMLL